MKRSEQLKKLSWEHHDALKFARNVGIGLSSGADLPEVAAYAIYVTDNFLVPHFGLEERALVSRLSAAQREQEAVRQVLDEHQAFARLRDEIAAAEAEQLPELLGRFRDMLKAHVRLEENHFFPYVEQTLTAEELSQAQAEIDRDHISACEEWGRSFLP